jgi:uncharacterized protein with PQ loop repeat
MENNEKQNENIGNIGNENNTFLYLNRHQWGWISVVTNGLSVVVQLYNLITTKSAQSFSMKFIFLMILLNFWYFIVAMLQDNYGFAIATMTFVLYNLTVVYYYYWGLK